MNVRIAPFRFEVTPPLGHALCGGWIKAAIAVDDPLEAIGYVLLGAGAPIVICAVDWTGLLNEAHLAWRQALAEAAGTTVERVAVHCVHQHNAPFVCFEVQRRVSAFPELPGTFDRVFFDMCLARGREAVSNALAKARPVTHVAYGSAVVDRVASNRRIVRDALGRVTTMRRSFCTDPVLQAMTEGLIDPLLRTVAYYDGDSAVVTCHFYATHPMSYYEDGRVSADFCGLARRQRQAEQPGNLQIYFTGCAGNVTAGKYNDGSPASRITLTQRVHAAMVTATATLKPERLQQVEWRADSILPGPNPALNAAELNAALAARCGAALVQRILPAFKLAWLEREARKMPVPLAALFLNGHANLFLPAELFVEYQLRAQALRPGRFVAVAAYGDDGPWYIPTKEEYPNGGYEVSVAFADESVDQLMTDALARLLV